MTETTQQFISDYRKSYEENIIVIGEDHLVGEPLAPEELSDFTYDYSWTVDYVNENDVGAFLDSLENEEIKDLYCRGIALSCLDGETFPFRLPEGHEPAEIERSYGFWQNSGFFETGINFISYYEAWKEVFTAPESRIGEKSYKYNDQLFMVYGSRQGDAGLVHKEYQLLYQSDKTIEIMRTLYRVKSGSPIVEYNPETPEKFDESVEIIRFELTEDGWRIAECPYYLI